MNKSSIETLVGAIIIVVAGLFSYFAYSSSNLKSVDGYRLDARFTSVDGIGSGSEVRIGGIKVGQVVEMDLDAKSYEAILGLQLREDIKLPEDSSASIVSSSLLGGKYINIEPGGMEDLLEDGDEIAFTQSAVNLESLIGKMVHSGGGVEEDPAAATETTDSSFGIE
jgi:phospholipid/cholesterol/gamma-HCH transport system substrate-binding protein